MAAVLAAVTRRGRKVDVDEEEEEHPCLKIENLITFFSQIEKQHIFQENPWIIQYKNTFSNTGRILYATQPNGLRTVTTPFTSPEANIKVGVSEFTWFPGELQGGRGNSENLSISWVENILKNHPLHGRMLGEKIPNLHGKFQESNICENLDHGFTSHWLGGMVRYLRKFQHTLERHRLHVDHKIPS